MISYNIFRLICIESEFDTLKKLKYIKYSDQIVNEIFDAKEQEIINILKTNSISLKYIDTQTVKICLEAVKLNCLDFQYVNIENQTEEICLEAVKQDGLVIIYVQNQTENICLEAVKQNGLAIQYINNQTENICLEAVKQNGLAIQYINNQTDEICLESVKQNGLALQYVDVQTEELCKIAYEQNNEAGYYVKDERSLYYKKREPFFYNANFANYAKNYNILRIISGMSGLAYS